MLSILALPLLLATLLTTPPMTEVLLVERTQDRDGRQDVFQKMKAIRVDFHRKDARISDVAGWFTTLTDGVPFLYLGLDKGTSSEPTLSLDLDQISLPNLLSLIAETTDLAFVYRNGVVMIKPKEEVRVETELVVYDLRAATAPLVSFRPPKLGGLRPSGYDGAEDVEEESSDSTLSGFTMEDIEQIVRENVPLKNWDDDGVFISSTNGLLVVRQTERGHAQIRAVLRAIGAG